MQKLWNEIQANGYTVRKNKLGGLESWQPIKERLSKATFVNYPDGIEINHALLKLIDKYYVVNDNIDHSDAIVIINNVVLKNCIEEMHFFIQHFRLCSMNSKLTVLKLAQIAYNAGQFLVEQEKGTYDNTINNFYKLYQLNALETFINTNADLDILFN